MANAAPRPLRGLALVMILLLAAQFIVGMIVNFYTTIPATHPGTGGGNYLVRSVRSVSWAVRDGGLALQLHAVLGLALAVIGLALVVLAARAQQGRWLVVTFIAAAAMIGAGFNGASFLDFGQDYSSLIMAIGLIVAMVAYTVGLYLTPPQ